MKVIVGLGNPGEKYKNNRHNAGYMFIDYFLAAYNSQLITQENKTVFKKNKYTVAEIAESKKLQVISYKLKEIVLIKPLTFMNNSGLSVKKLIANCKLQVASELIVTHDDLDIPLGKFKIQKGTGPKLHNGIESIEKEIEATDFWRVRIGVDNRTRENWIDGYTYVLEDFTPEEKKKLYSIFSSIFDYLQNKFFISP